jgi:hypothetical protein
MEDVIRRQNAGIAPTPEQLPQGQIDLPVTPPPEKAFPMFQEPGVNEGMKPRTNVMKVPGSETPKLDSNYQIIDETKPQAVPGAPTEDILEIVKRLLASRGQ